MTIKKAKNGWSFRADVGIDPRTGKRKQVYRSGFKTKKEAENALAEIKLQVTQGEYFEPTNQKFGEYIYHWLESVYKTEVQITTYEKAEGVIRCHLAPYFQTYNLKDIKAYDIDKFYAAKLNQGLAHSYVKIMHNVLSKAFKKAISWDLIQENPMEKVTTPKVSSTTKIVWSVQDAKRFLGGCTQLSEKIPFIIAIFTGMRRGEILALKWRNVNLDEGILYVRENLVQTKAGLVLKGLKTKSSLRDVQIADFVIEMLREHKKEQMQERGLKVSEIEDHFVVCAEGGQPIFPRNLLRKFYSVILRVDVPRISFHALRHTHATILMAMGENPKAVSERLGHSNVSVTLDIYTHINRAAHKQTAKRFEEGFLE